jgi:BirA family biotin operon repressor/biotin-[acetyl-CoA-carboxylase] ligase
LIGSSSSGRQECLPHHSRECHSEDGLPHHRTGYSLERLRAGLKPFRLHFFSTLRSTSDHAAVLRKRGELFAPSVVVTPRQTAGRGRGSNTWFSAAGSLTVTFVLPVNPILAPHHLPLAAGLAARNAAAELAGNNAIQLKWPNDLVYAQLTAAASKAPLRKLAGLLCERLDNVDLIGIGMNVNVPRRRAPRELRERIVFLEELRLPEGGAFDLTDVLIVLARYLHGTLVRRSETPFPLLLREYDRHHALVGRRVTVRGAHEPAVSGRCLGLDDAGRLLVRDRKRVHRVIAGNVELA